MILVIADDFTGAAELAGIATEFGLKTEVQTTFEMNPDADVIIVDTNTRSKTAEEAVTVLDELLESVMQYEFDFLYKKTDSVLRGHVYEELSVLLKHYPGKSVLLAPSNPSRGRTISNETYYIDGKPLHKTFFSDDPESPMQASDIYSLINAGKKDRIKVLETPGEIPEKSGMIYVAEAKNTDEINHWVSRIDERVIATGAAEFFKAILESKKYYKSLTTADKIDFDSRNTLFVCGSSLSRVVNIEEELFSKNPKVVEVSENQICSEGNSGKTGMISQEVIDHFEATNNVILFVNTSKSPADLPTHKIPECLAAITCMILGKIELNELFIEGGTTSSEVVRKIGWTRFNSVSQIGEDMVRMQVIKSPSTFITVKPGSYKWPDDLWRQILGTQHKHQS